MHINIPDHVLYRKGAQKVKDIPDEVQQLLQTGQLQTVNLTEWLAVDHTLLLRHVIDELDLKHHTDVILSELELLRDKKMMKIIPAIAKGWLHLLNLSPSEERSRVFDSLANHCSDSVRCWAAYIIGLDDQLSLSQKLTAIRPFAADLHFGVREIAWMAVREPVAKELTQALHLFENWVCDDDANIRRFAIECTRPQGVWAKHIQELKDNPALAFPLLDQVKSDHTKYVQDSVGNWLNDASKTKPEWVLKTCNTWLEQSGTKDTKRIVARAQRTIIKK
ncbi:DNA alkylation repair protein [Paenibacillus sp. UMB4589-SE434]|uniref:DNA alkylation repair protein n=1 Tax=Paenibacillus sp. UMB4589-SE434 TaxID=3046314 RepID=UPI00254E8BCC|nr:DNA alkylation repair protein [Paenibacillus sp. UMB4589-SE434]MDK8182391.1 DNA alkylation repair protein [Paenibacillus sp. UMB4589-SE434]